MKTTRLKAVRTPMIAALLMSFSFATMAASPAPNSAATEPPLQLSQAQQWPPPPTQAAPATQPAQPTQPTPPASKPARTGNVTLPAVSAQAPPAAGFADAFGRFNVTLPSGIEQVSATYNLALPASSLQINISAAPHDAVFQNSLQTFPDTMRQKGALNVGQQQFEHRGRQATMVLVRLRDPQGATMQSLNVFIPGANVWLQVNGPEHSAKQVEETMQVLLQNIQHR